MNRRVVIVLTAGLVAMLAACGDDPTNQALQEERTVAPDPVVANSVVADSVVANSVVANSVVTVTPTGVVVSVIALDNSFRPEQLTIQVGDEVLWENNGRNEHNILNIESADEGFAADGAWGIDVEAFQPGDVFSHIFTEPGNYRYYCTIHGNTDVGMVGTIIVEA